MGGPSEQDKTLSVEDIDFDELSIEEAVDRVEEIIDTIERGDISISQAQELHEEATELLDYIERQASIEEGTIERVDVK